MDFCQGLTTCLSYDIIGKMRTINGNDLLQIVENLKDISAEIEAVDLIASIQLNKTIAILQTLTEEEHLVDLMSIEEFLQVEPEGR